MRTSEKTLEPYTQVKTIEHKCYMYVLHDIKIMGQLVYLI